MYHRETKSSVQHSGPTNMFNRPPGVYTPLSNAGLLDGVHLQESHSTIGKGKNKGPVIKLEDFSFYPRVSNWFGRK